MARGKTENIVLDSISKKIGSRILFEDVTVTLSSGNRYGLTGPNGSGKSTLIKIMMGVEEPTSGHVSLPEKVGYLRQNIEAFKQSKVSDVVIMGNARLWSAFVERDQLYEKEMTDEIGMRLGEIEEIIADENGYMADSEAEILLSGTGIPLEFHEKRMEEIPTDLQFRVLICQALFGQPDALLLDEPTNHLDLESIRWLENFLKIYEGTFVVISHDRHFLNTVTTHIADIDYDTIIVYPGNYDDMVIAKTQVRQRTESQNKSKEKKVSQLKEFVSKFSAGTRASQVQSRLREIERLQPQELKQSNIQRPYIRFLYPVEKQSGKIILKLEQVSKTYDGPKVIKNFSLEVLRGEKIAIIGNNGRGKSTLLKMMAQVLTPTSGSVEIGHNIDLGYFPQNHADIVDKEEPVSIFDWLKDRHSKLYDQEIRSALGKMLFSGDDAFKKVGALSGGETARLVMAHMMLSEHNTLILDEPNNHLDLEAVSALGWALEDYKGTVIIASHDRDLINHFSPKIISLEKDQSIITADNLEEYLSTCSSQSKSFNP